jgi:predicted MFS family arabinose efflux permease
MSRDFRAYWTAEVTSTFGSMFTATAVGIVAVTMFNGTAAEIGVVVAAGTLPTVLFGLLSGVVADRVGRPRRVLIAIDAIAAAAVLLLALGIWTGWATVWWLAAFNLLLGTLGLLIGPIYFTHLGAIVDGTGERDAGSAGRHAAGSAERRADDVVRARAKLQSGQYAARITGRAAAGPVIAIGAAFGLFIDALTYLVSLILLLSIRAPDRRAAQPEPAGGRRSQASVRGQIAEGVRELRRQRFLYALVTFLVVLSLVSGGIAALTAPFVLRTLGVPVTLFGLLYAVTGVAGLAGSLVATRLVSRVSNSSLALAGFAGAAGSLLIFPLAGGGPIVTAVVAGLGVALPILFGAVANVGLTGVMTVDVPAHVLGRVTATMQTAVTTAQFAGALLGGLLGDVIGVRSSLFVCGLVALCSVGLLLSAARKARRPGGTDAVAAPRVAVPA